MRPWTVLRLLIWSVVPIWLIFLTYQIGPDTEQRLWPVIGNQGIADITRTYDEVCLKWTYTKNWKPKLLAKVAFLDRGDGIRYPSAEWRPDLHKPSDDETAAEAGVTRTIPECFSVPLVLRSTTPLILTWSNIYEPWHGQWNVVQPLPTVQIDIPPDPGPKD